MPLPLCRTTLTRVRAFQIPAIVAREQQIVAAAALALAGVQLTGRGFPVD
jgi:hypothetical protein